MRKIILFLLITILSGCSANITPGATALGSKISTKNSLTSQWAQS